MSLYRKLELLLAGGLYYSGFVKLARWWTRRSGKKLILLCYHHASGGNLREHLLYLKRHYRLLHLEAALEELYQTTTKESGAKNKQTMLALTFDDGYHDLYTRGLPLARELQIPLTIFLIPGYIESGNRFWWQEPEYLLRHARVKEITLQNRTYHLDDAEERSSLLQTIDVCLRTASSVKQREAFLETVRNALAVPSSTQQAEQEKELLPLQWSEVREMEDSQWISFGAHTMHHPTLAYLNDPAELQYEVSECRLALERQLGHPVRVFAYPIGKEGAFTERDRQAVKAATYAWAVTAIHGLNTSQTCPYLLHRIVVDVDQHWLMIAAKASGLWDFLVHPGRIPISALKNMFKWGKGKA
jgi:peptidoglycan/xylan/chitin deacetylase (PgdA/CDA1 family)